MSKVCSFTGHRPSKFNFKHNENDVECIKLKAKLINEIEKLYFQGVKIFLTGCAMGVDIWCAEIVLQLMKKYTDIQLYCVLPCNNHNMKWNEEYKNRLKNIMENCTRNIFLQEDYTNDCYFKRNKYLVDKYNVILGVYDINLERCGTKNNLKYAINQNKDIMILTIKEILLRIIENSNR